MGDKVEVTEDQMYPSLYLVLPKDFNHRKLELFVEKSAKIKKEELSKELEYKELVKGIETKIIIDYFL